MPFESETEILKRMFLAVFLCAFFALMPKLIQWLKPALAHINYQLSIINDDPHPQPLSHGERGAIGEGSQ